ncbi:MAG TPA: hypothetical protein VN494_00305 [Patescibacteria group bacterium]|nr:hypothetical protein [Patescibacteria group bacterium]
MAIIFLLGPGMLDPAEAQPADPAPMQVRRNLAEVFGRHGHTVILMEDDPDRQGEDLIQKFDRLLQSGVTDIVLYWPPRAKMQTTYDELILLCDRLDLLEKRSVRLWALHHSSVATITRDEFKILETGSRSRYLTAVASRLVLCPLEWETKEDLNEQILLLSAEL